MAIITTDSDTFTEGNTIVVTVEFETGDPLDFTIDVVGLASAADFDPPPNIPFSVSFPPGTTAGTTQTFNLVVASDNIAEGEETFILQAEAPASGSSGAITISDSVGGGGADAGSGTLSIISVTPNPVVEGNASVTFQVRYTAGTAPIGLQSFTVETIDGTAREGTQANVATNQNTIDYIEVNRTFTFGDTAQDDNPGLTTTQDFFITVPINDDTIIEQTESFSLVLQDVDGAFIGTDTQVAFIADNDGQGTPTPNARGTIQFEFDSYNTVEGQGFVDLRVIRVGGQNGVINAEVLTRAGTAVAPGDYTTPNQTSVFFGDGDTSPKTIRIPIIDDTDPLEVTEQFSVDLIETISPGQTQVIETAIVTIEDNDSSAGIGSLDFDPVVYTVDEGAGAVTVNLVFSGGNIPTSFDFTVESADGTAVQGIDFSFDELTLESAPGIDGTIFPVVIPIIDDSIAEITESFSISLGDTEGVFPGASSAVINIIDNDSGPGASIPPSSNPGFNPFTPFPVVTFATQGDDFINGSDGDDSLFGNLGNDTILGLDGSDQIFGEEDNDSLSGNRGVDFINGNAGDDAILGGQDGDVLRGGRGNDALFGQMGDDFLLAGDRGIDILNGGQGADRFAVEVLGPGDNYDYIADFELGIDQLALLGGLQFGSLVITDGPAGAVITQAGSTDALVVVGGIAAGSLGADNFINI
ncbi:Na-Ca exchanger/integrin-beta4 [Thalassoporum mexicanum PCC 7367]|uniref:Calx-beta domain-containing protein n=1 Tax=Thalassoporum mexicanum TaxID=3457544 RepID=UPI00029FE68B|nr:Calx-beta domain-containing protein [Pseudanabaena sp. PCC 7367]AFY68491.1 Na-Ca exchanger/integrin-beta4 [Pseudanabaena sp. PCC 7367]